MYFESNSVNREGWKFAYKGQELIVCTDRLLKRFKAQEMAARNKMSELIKDANISHNDDRIKTCKVDIEKNGREAEACSVWLNEFIRVPEREYFLTLGDVVYFGLPGTSP